MSDIQLLDSDPDTVDVPYFERLRSLLGSYSREERRTLAHIKRFLECVYGDDEFLEAVRADKSPMNVRRLARQRGSEIDPLGLASIWDREGPLPLKYEEMGEGELTDFWAEWLRRTDAIAPVHRGLGDTETVFPRFHKWRRRQIARCATEIGMHANKISHPVMSLELSNGCSVGCSDCGVGADKLRANFRHTPENAALWRSVLEAATARFGTAIQTAFCYWATEPIDNPDYVEFVEDFREITGELPQTTTIAPLRNVEKTKRLLELHRRHEAIQNRFSIQSLEMFRDVHAAFSAEELESVKLLMYHQKSQLRRTRAGRAYEQGVVPEELWDGGTIACVSGFLVNMCSRTIRLISPCPASDEWPNGYRVFYSGTFETAEDFDACILEAAELCMLESFSNDQVVGFRPDLSLENVENGIALRSRYREMTFSAKPFLHEMGRMIAERRYRPSEVNGSLIRDGADFLDVFATMQSLFDGGFLDESYTIHGTSEVVS